MPEKEGAEEKTTKSVVNKKQKQMMGEEGYDVARDEGRVRPSKDKKDATSYPVSDEMKKTQKVNKGPSALDIVKKKYKGQIMDIKKEELDLTQVAETFGGYLIEGQYVQGDPRGMYDFDQLQKLRRLERKSARNTNKLLDVLNDPNYDPDQFDADIRAGQAQKDLMRNPNFNPEGPRSARKRFKNQP